MIALCEFLSLHVPLWIPYRREPKTYRAFIEWEQCECGCQPTYGCARLFEKSKTKLADDGMPDAAWVWACNIKVIGTTILVKAAERVPPVNGREALEELGRSLGCKTLIWQRLKRGKLILKSFPL